VASEINAAGAKGDATLQQERSDLINDPGAPANESIPYPMKSLQVELIISF